MIGKLLILAVLLSTWFYYEKWKAVKDMKKREARKRYPKRWYHVEEVQNN
jgi:hypothetical protein